MVGVFIPLAFLLVALSNARITIPVTQKSLPKPLPEYNVNGASGAFLRADDEQTATNYHYLNLTILNGRNLAYFGQMYVGEKNTPFLVLLDTGSNNIWLPTTDCKECPGKTIYVCNESSTCSMTNQTIIMPYGIGSVQGPIGFENIGLTLDFKVNSTIVWVTSGRDLQNYKDLDGFVGLGNMEKARDFIDLAFDAGYIQEKVFSFYLDHNYRNDTYSNGSYLSIGYIPEDKVNKVTWVQVTNPYRWATAVKGMKVGNIEVNLTQDASNTKEVLFDSGWSLLLLSDYVIAELYNQLVASAAEFVMFMDMAPAYRCDYGYPEKYPNISISVDGMDIILTAYNYLMFSQVVQQDGKNYCMLGFMRANVGIQILGDSFLKTNFVTFSKRNQTMGIYQEFPPIILPPAPQPKPTPEPTPTPTPKPENYQYFMIIGGVVFVVVLGLVLMKNKKGARKLEKALDQDSASDYYNAAI